jgi:effector-binding domain-containing protein
MKTIGEAMAPVFQRLYETLAAKGIQPSGAPWVRYLCIGEDVEFEVAAPTAREIEAPGGMISGSTAGCDYARTLHVGPYERIGAAYSAVTTWLAENALVVAGAPWEVYLTDPMSQPDPAKYETLVYCPVTPVEEPPSTTR